MNILILLCAFSHVQLSLLFKIKINVCSADSGVTGFCRQAADCVGVTEALTSAGCPGSLVCCPSRNISRSMCYEYGDAVYTNADGALNLMAHLQEPGKDDECAITGVPLIVGGEKAIPKEFPHMAAIGFGRNVHEAKWMCGGSLISEHYVLTAAHCVDNTYAGRPRFIKLGVLNMLDDQNTNLQLYKIQKSIIHPKFMKRDKTNDIALLRLDREVEFTPFVRPACLDYKGNMAESTVIATGWGKTSHDETTGSPDLMKVQVNIIGRPECTKAYKYKLPKGLLDSNMCAGVLEGGKDTCQGDSGGPIQTVKKEPYCMYSVVGLTSFGLTCGYAWSPAVYTRIFTYVPWIESIVWPHNT